MINKPMCCVPKDKLPDTVLKMAAASSKHGGGNFGRAAGVGGFNQQGMLGGQTQGLKVLNSLIDEDHSIKCPKDISLKAAQEAGVVLNTNPAHLDQGDRPRFAVTLPDKPGSHFYDLDSNRQNEVPDPDHSPSIDDEPPPLE
eukprot:CAMPEP_0197630508 /NCGR_PEP_ID=MMETSP1338-20131121/7971_1 /TAXON_ID=43686 ORGANISM="Pelagodinium beii, Strain RCC1491" /NCGR_SAMPLE_ID=MMETSP1338 /ASSEMBLY_ACC=CAM_ASM_000754 /LENGTH=141 /DNA_ID=CAMNT_0043201739 /DNA_START=132 /DNA_END=557 /DNA_ORIENTATION=-